MKDQLRQYIATHIMRHPTYHISDDESLIKGGMIDSFSLVEIAIFIEETFGVHMDDTELTADNMDTINKMAAAIQSKQ